MNDFYFDKSDFKKLENFFRHSPRLLRPVTANVLNSLAFDNRKLNVRNISNSMIIRNRRFLESSLQVQKTHSGPIDRQIAYSGSVNRPRFTGWEEQQEGKTSKTKRAVTLAGRRGSKKNIAISKARLKPGNKFYKPSQFPGPTTKSKFNFMMRVLNNRGSGEFIITNSLRTQRGHLRPGLYQLRGHKLRSLQQFNINKSTHIPWMTKSVQQQTFGTDIMKKYKDGINRIIAKYN